MTLAQKKKEAKSIQPVRELKNQTDSLSYSVGTMLANEMFKGLLLQLKVVRDTTELIYAYQDQIEAVGDNKQKKQLEKKLKTKLDSLKMANEKNLEMFSNGFTTTFLSKVENNAYNSGAAVASMVRCYFAEFEKEFNLGDTELDNKAFALGFTQKLIGAPLLLDNPEEVLGIIALGDENPYMKMQETEKEENAERIAASELFFAQNKEKSDVITLQDGLQYKIEKQGDGPIPKMGDEVIVHYRGTFLDGTVFDDSIEYDMPPVFRVGQLIKGLNEALLLMPEGSKWTIYIPYNLAYGSRDMDEIKPYSSLVFELDLIKVEHK